VVWSARHGFDQGRLYYWLDTVKVRAPQAAIILVATHTDQRSADLPLAELKDKYPQIIGQYSISNRTAEGVEALRQAIVEVTADMPLMGEYWPKKWLNAATAIREEKAKGIQHIPPNQLTELMTQNGVTGYSQQVLGRWLHELGEILYFHE